MLPNVAVIVTAVAVVTFECLTLKVALVFPADTTTEPSTAAAEGFELVRITSTPALGAGPLSVTVPVTAVAEPPITLVGLTFREDKIAG